MLLECILVVLVVECRLMLDDLEWKLMFGLLVFGRGHGLLYVDVSNIPEKPYSWDQDSTHHWWWLNPIVNVGRIPPSTPKHVQVRDSAHPGHWRGNRDTA